ncbi:hypothetical protein Cantr_00776 [Candida viswanathii]|uniref:Uncharacterized protein n=1 Tax=Candida viswanathii TaxID=5486 RepID=A0A367YIC0_9ASCO|nr:hypothetical protein Cantr_00776 [Candida viswanathii]
MTSSASSSTTSPIKTYLESLNPVDQLFINFQANLRNELRDATVTWLMKTLFEFKSQGPATTTTNGSLIAASEALNNELDEILQENIKLEFNDLIIEELIRKTTLEYVAYMQVRRSAIVQNVKEQLQNELAP